MALIQDERSWKRKAFAWKSIQKELELKFGKRSPSGSLSKKMTHLAVQSPKPLDFTPNDPT